MICLFLLTSCQSNGQAFFGGTTTNVLSSEIICQFLIVQNQDTTTLFIEYDKPFTWKHDNRQASFDFNFEHA